MVAELRMSYHSISEPCVFVAPKGSRKRKRHHEGDHDGQSLCKSIDLLDHEIETILYAENTAVINKVVLFIRTNKSTDALAKLPCGFVLSGGESANREIVFTGIAEQLARDSTTACYFIALEAGECSNLRAGLKKAVTSILQFGHAVHDATRILKYDLRLADAWQEYQHSKGQGSITIVIALRSLENFGPRIANDLITLLAGHRNIDFRILCDVSTDIHYLKEVFSVKTVKLLSISAFEVEPSESVIDKIVAQQLIDKPCRLRLSFEVYSCLLNNFQRSNSVDGFVSALRYVRLCHSWQNPVACLSEKESVDDFELTPDMCRAIRSRYSFRDWAEDQLESSSQEGIESVVKALSDDAHFTTIFRRMVRAIHEYQLHLADALQLLFVLVEHTRTDNPKVRSIAELYRLMLKQGLCNSNIVKDILLRVKVLRPETLQRVFEVCLARTKLAEHRATLQGLNDDLTTVLTTSDDHSDTKPEPLAVKVLASSFSRPSKSSSPSRAGQNGSTPLQDLKTEYEKRAEFASRASATATKTAAEATRLKLSHTEKSFTALVDKVHAYLSSTFARDLYPHTRLPLHELFWFDASEPFTARFAPEVRKSLRVAFGDADLYTGATELHPQTSAAWKLYQDSGHLINVFDWFQAFRQFYAPGVEVDDDVAVDVDDEEARRQQALFVRSVGELQFLGFFKSTKRKTDHVQKCITIL